MNEFEKHPEEARARAKKKRELRSKMAGLGTSFKLYTAAEDNPNLVLIDLTDLEKLVDLATKAHIAGL